MTERNHADQTPDNQVNHLEGEILLTPRGIVERRLPSVYIGERKLSDAYEPLHLEHGEVDLFPDAILDQILDDYYTSGEARRDLHKNRAADTSEADRNIRDFYEISDKPHIVFSTEGSDALLERLINIFPNPPIVSRVGVIGPCFPNFVNFIKQRYRTPEDEDGEGTRIMPITSPLHQGADAALEKAIRFQKRRKKFKPETYFLCLPTTPTGEMYSDELVDEFLESTEEHEDLVVIDSAFIHSTGRSTIPYTEKHTNVIVLETMNKAILPGLGIGYAVMSPELARAYDSIRRPLDVRQKMQIHVLNKITNRTFLESYLSGLQNTVYQRKDALQNALDDYGIRYLPTHPFVPIMTIDGEYEGFYDATAEVSLGVARGSAFQNTHGDMTDRYVRITAAAVEVEKAEEVAFRMRMAKAIAASS